MNLYGMVGNDAVNQVDVIGWRAYNEDEINTDVYGNWSWNYNFDSFTAEYCGCEPSEVERAVSQALFRFRNFDYPSVELSIDGNVASFNPQGGGGAVNDWFGGFLGVGNEHNVTLLHPGGNFEFDQAAATNDGHGLVGMRIWDSEGEENENNCNRPHSITAKTYAFETWNNTPIVEVAINREAKKMWPDYLSDTVLGILKDKGCNVCRTKSKADYSMTNLPSQKNPFSDLLPPQ